MMAFVKEGLIQLELQLQLNRRYIHLKDKKIENLIFIIINA
ncbi:MAG: hypothetical protein H6Q69_2817 [Firmicutes bacterium]|nr:hypothetical protein [Bacillota bacterium]